MIKWLCIDFLLVQPFQQKFKKTLFFWNRLYLVKNRTCQISFFRKKGTRLVQFLARYSWFQKKQRFFWIFAETAVPVKNRYKAILSIITRKLFFIYYVIILESKALLFKQTLYTNDVDLINTIFNKSWNIIIS